MTQVTVVARILASVEHQQVVGAALKQLAQAVRANEPGVLDYSLHQDNETPELFIMLESYQDYAAFQAHLNTEHLKLFQQAIDGKLQELTWRELTPV